MVVRLTENEMSVMNIEKKSRRVSLGENKKERYR